MITLTTIQLVFIIVSNVLLGISLSWGYFEYRHIKEFKKLKQQTKVSQGMAEVAFTIYRQVIDERQKEINHLKEKLK